jgi:hypothetical protein
VRRVSVAAENERPASGEQGERLAAAINARCPVLEITRQPTPVVRCSNSFDVFNTLGRLSDKRQRRPAMRTQTGLPIAS